MILIDQSGKTPRSTYNIIRRDETKEKQSD